MWCGIACRKCGRWLIRWGLDEAGLGLVALNSLVSEVQKLTDCSIELRYAGPKEAWSQETSELLYRILQEALSNIIRHAQATQVSVHIKEQEEDLFMQVEDNGVFIQQQLLVPGFGLSSMKARCERVGGSMTIEAIHPHGMKLTVCIPHGGIKSTSGGGEL